MKIDWTLEQYQALCRAVQSSGYTIQTLVSYLQQPQFPAVILRHDIDRFPINAIKMAKLEHTLGISSTYYVRHVPFVIDPKLLKTLYDLGHEIGYHYEVLSKARGNVEAAIKLFAEELAYFRKIVPVHTAAAHGSPLSRWNNLTLWDHCHIDGFDLTGEAYVSLDYSKVAYYTDTGRAWDANSANLRDRPLTGAEQHIPTVRTTASLIDLIGKTKLPLLCIQTHPERWNDSVGGSIRSAAWDYCANMAKRMLKIKRRLL